MREPVVHELRTWVEPYDAIEAGLKPWELRFDDRDFQVGDTLRLRRFDETSETYTGAQMDRRVIWMMRNPAFGTQRGFVVMSLAPPEGWEANSELADHLRGMARDFGETQDLEQVRILLEAAKRLDAADAPPGGEEISCLPHPRWNAGKPGERHPKTNAEWDWRATR